MDSTNIRCYDIDKAMYSTLYNDIQTKTILKSLIRKKSYSRVHKESIVPERFADNRENSMATEKAMNELEILLLSSQLLVEDCIASFSDIMNQFKIA